MEVRKKFREWTPDQNVMESVSPSDVLPEDDLVFFLLETIPHLDLAAFYAHYEGETRGAPPFNVPMMCTLLVYSYSIGVFSSRKIAAACERNLAFLAIVGFSPVRVDAFDGVVQRNHVAFFIDIADKQESPHATHAPAPTFAPGISWFPNLSV